MTVFLYQRSLITPALPCRPKRQRSARRCVSAPPTPLALRASRPSPPGAGLLQMSKEAEEVLLLPFRLSHFAGGGSFVRVGVEDVEGEASDDGKVFGGVILAGAGVVLVEDD